MSHFDINRPNSSLVQDIVSDVLAGISEDKHKLLSISAFALITAATHLARHLEYFSAGLLLWRCGVDIIENVLEGDIAIIKEHIQNSIQEEAKLRGIIIRG